MVTQLQGLRGVVCAFTFAAALSAQITVIPFPERWPLLRSYLGLLGAQADALDEVSQPYWISTGRLDKRREELETEIFAETERSPLRPAELGRLHAEWETIRREYSALEKNRKEATRAILNDTQRAKLRAFDEVIEQRRVAEELWSSGLTAVDCTDPRRFYDSVCTGTIYPAVSKIPEWGPRPEDQGPGLGVGGGSYPRAKRYLGLTTDQVERLQQNQTQVYSGNEITRMKTVVAEIYQETRKETLDEMALGVRFAEVEALRRKMGEDTARLIALNREVLTPAQKVKLDALIEAMRLMETTKDARSLNLMGSRCEERGYVFWNDDGRLGFELFRAYIGDCPDRRALEEVP